MIHVPKRLRLRRVAESICVIILTYFFLLTILVNQNTDFGESGKVEKFVDKILEERGQFQKNLKKIPTFQHNNSLLIVSQGASDSEHEINRNDNNNLNQNGGKGKKKLRMSVSTTNNVLFMSRLHWQFWHSYPESKEGGIGGNGSRFLNIFSDNEVTLDGDSKNQSFFPAAAATTKLKNMSPFSPQIVQNGKGSQLNFPLKNNFIDDDSYDTRIVQQLVWGMKAEKMRPGVFKFNKTKKIVTSLETPHVVSCPGSDMDGRCEILNENYLQNKDVDAYVFGQNNFNFNPPTDDTAFKIFYVLESASNTPSIRLSKPNEVLASFWRGSEIRAPYAQWVYYDPTVRKMSQDKNFAAGKTKMAAIFVSNCGGSNDRLLYVKELQKYVEVDVYGGCGKFECSRINGDSCFEKIAKEYRFYLAFENSNCRDYITEKFFSNALSHDIIPVVLGAHPEDYKAVSPQGSYIHVEDFESPKELADYMNLLTKDDDRYNEYFGWKGTGEFVNTFFFCRVCAMLFYADGQQGGGLNPGRNESVSWSPDAMCLPRRQWYWNRSNF